MTHIFIAHVEELVKLDSAVRKGTEGTLLLEISSQSRICNFSLQQYIRIK